MSSKLRQILSPFSQTNLISSINSIPNAPLILIRTATKRAAGSRTSMKDSAGRRLGMKASDGEPVKAGQIIYRQRGTRFYPGENADIGKDHTIFAKEPGFVRYYYDPFHPKRRLIGIALSSNDQLPTPHFEPRKRRLGYVPITNEKKIQEAKEWLPRKQTLALPKILSEVQKREEAREARAKELANKLTSFTNELSEEEIIQSSKRLVTISNYLAGGRDISLARSFTDSHFIQNTRLSGELNKISLEESNAIISKYQSLAAKVDSLVSFDANRNLVKSHTQQELQTMKEESIKKLIELSSTKPITNEIKTEVSSILSKPCFSLSEQVNLKRKYSKPEPPTLIKDNETLKSFEKLAKDGKGSIIQSWNYAKRKVDKFFLPSGTSKFAIR